MGHLPGRGGEWELRESGDAERRNVEKREPNATSRRATCDSCIDGSIGTLKTQANLNVPIRIHRQFQENHTSGTLEVYLNKQLINSIPSNPTFRFIVFRATVVACESERCISLGFPTFRCVHPYNCRHLPPEFGDASAAECSSRPGALHRATSRLTGWLGVQTGLSPHTHRFLIKFGTKDASGSNLKGVLPGAPAGHRERVGVARAARCRTPER